MLYLRPFDRFPDPQLLLLQGVPVAYHTVQLMQMSPNNRFRIIAQNLVRQP